MTCNTTSDCEFLEDVVKFCYAASVFTPASDTNCDCLYWYGWTGDRCDIPTVNTYILRFTMILISIWSLLLLILVSRTLRANLRLGFNPSKALDPLFFTAPGIIVFCILMLIFCGLQLNALFNSNAFERINYGLSSYLHEEPFFQETVGIAGGQLENMVLALTFACLNLITHFLTLSLHKTVTSLGRFKGFASIENKDRARSYAKFILGYLVFASTFFIVEAFFVISALHNIIYAVQVGNFMLKVSQFNSVLHDLVKEDDEDVNSVVSVVCKFVGKIGRRTLACGIIILVAIISYVLTAILAFQYMGPGDLNYSALLRDTSILFVLLKFTYVAWYFNSTTEGVIILEDSCSSRLFKYWDKMNSEIFPERPVVLESTIVSKRVLGRV